MLQRSIIKFAILIVMSQYICFVQSVYFVPSTNRHVPTGKLYWKVTHMLSEQRKLSGIVANKRDRTVTTEGMEESIATVLKVLDDCKYKSNHHFDFLFVYLLCFETL